jgi:alpha-D-xyloside xylohydrolase
MSDWLSKAFPQKAAAGGFNSRISRQQRVYGPSIHRRTDLAEIWRAETVQSLDINDGDLKLTVLRRKYYNRLVQTHETEMFQYERSEDTDECSLRLTLFDPCILRIRFGEDVDTGVYDNFMSREQRMLIAEPGSARFELIEESDDGWILHFDSYRLSILREPVRLVLRDQSGEIIWQQKKRDLFTADTVDLSSIRVENGESQWEAFDLFEREKIVGLGERFDAVVRNGKSVDFRNKDAIGTSNGRTYINVPFVMSSRGYGVFINSSANMEWEIGTHELSTFGFSVDDVQLEYFVIPGPKPEDILKGYHSLTGDPRIPPIWSYGLWLSRNSYISWDVVEEVVRESDQRKIPFDVIHLDTAWFKEDWNCDLEFSPERFPEPEKHMDELKAHGVRVSLWQYNFIPNKPNNHHLDEAIERRYYVAGTDGKPYAYDPACVGSWLDDIIIDFTNPEAYDWYCEKIEKLMALGASAIKVDFGEGVPDEGLYHAIEGKRLHNLYSLVYNAAIAEATHRVTGEWIVWSRSGTAGSQRYPLHWGGDSQCSWSGLAGTLKAALSIGLSGIPFFSHDIGGYIGRPDSELYIRWAQFGLLSSHSRTHGVGDDNSREPWTYGSEAERIFRHFAELRYRLLAYLVRSGYEAQLRSLPVVRHLCLGYPGDDTAWTIEDQYMLGNDLLVAPILRPMDELRTRRVYLPHGVWFDFWTGKRIDGNGWITINVSLDYIPIFVRDGAAIPMAEYRNRTWNQIPSLEEIHCYGDVRTCEVPDSEGNIRVLTIPENSVDFRVDFQDDPIRIIRY